MSELSTMTIKLELDTSDFYVQLEKAKAAFNELLDIKAKLQGEGRVL